MTRTTRKGGVPRGRPGGGAAATTPTPAPAPAAAPLWLVTGSLVLSLLGLAASLYLTYEHLTGSTTLACPEGQVVSCAKVTSSEFSRVLGVPVVYPGLLYFLALTALCLPALWRAPRYDLPRLALVTVGLVAVLYLVWAETQVGAICLWCTVVHVVTLLLFLLLVWARALVPERGRRTR